MASESRIELPPFPLRQQDIGAERSRALETTRDNHLTRSQSGENGIGVVGWNDRETKFAGREIRGRNADPVIGLTQRAEEIVPRAVEEIIRECRARSDRL